MMNKKIKYKTNTIISMMFLKWIEKRTGIFLETF